MTLVDIENLLTRKYWLKPIVVQMIEARADIGQNFLDGVPIHQPVTLRSPRQAKVAGCSFHKILDNERTIVSPP